MKAEFARQFEEHDRASRSGANKPTLIPLKYRLLFIGPLVGSVLFLYGYSIYGFKQIKNAILQEEGTFRRGVEDSARRHKVANYITSDHELQSPKDANDQAQTSVTELDALTDSDLRWRA